MCRSGQLTAFYIAITLQQCEKYAYLEKNAEARNRKLLRFNFWIKHKERNKIEKRNVFYKINTKFYLC